MRVRGGGREAQMGGVYVYIQLICFLVQQKVTQHCKATILQLKKKVPYLCRQMPSLPA